MQIRRWLANVVKDVLLETMILQLLEDQDKALRQSITAEMESRRDQAMRGFNPLWISLCAGFGEEMLFRGAPQPLLGLWLTSLVGIAFIRVGLIAAIVTHTAADVVTLWLPCCPLLRRAVLCQYDALLNESTPDCRQRRRSTASAT